MEKLLAEQPLVASLILGALAAGLIYGWLQTGKKAAAIIALVLVLLIPLTWVVADRWETDREKIESLIYEAAAAVERNDPDAAVKIIGDAQTKARARQELSKWKFEVAKVYAIRSITVVDDATPPEADVDMNVKVKVGSNSGGIRNIQVPRRLILRMKKPNQDWVITDYRHLPIVGGPDQHSGANTLSKP